VVANFSRVIDQVRNAEYRRSSKEDKSVYKGARYLLLKNSKNVRCKDHRQQLEELLALNEVINTVMILKDKLKHIWAYRSRTWAEKALKSMVRPCSIVKSPLSKLFCTYAGALPLRDR